MNASEAAVNTSEPRGFNGSERCPRDARVAQLVFPAAYTALFLAGLLLNGLALWVFLHIPSSSTFIVYLKNTLVADLLMALTLPFKILSDARLGPWQLRAFVCRFSAIVFYEAMYAAIILLGLIAFDRCLKILRPFGKFSVQRPAFARAVSALAWAFLFALSLPNMVLTDREATPASVRKCAALKGPRGLAWHQLVNDVSQAIFWTVLALMLLFYAIIAWKVYASHRRAQGRDSRGQKKVEGKVFVVVAVFFVCFAPFHFARVPYTRSQTRGGGADCRLQDRLYLAKESTLFLAATNICMDPLIYIFLCRKFRDRLPCWKRRRGNSAPGPENQSSQTDNMTLS